MPHLHSLPLRTADFLLSLQPSSLCIVPSGGTTMPDSPANLLTKPKTASVPTERMATPEELQALERMAEVEQAIADLTRTETALDRNPLEANWQSLRAIHPPVEEFHDSSVANFNALHNDADVKHPASVETAPIEAVPVKAVAQAPSPGKILLPAESPSAPQKQTQSQAPEPAPAPTLTPAPTSPLTSALAPAIANQAVPDSPPSEPPSRKAPAIPDAAADSPLVSDHAPEPSPIDRLLARSADSPADSWLLELASILDQHRVWVESGGEAGSKADLCGANLENADLTGVNLQGAFLQRANLKGADLSMANLRHASLVQADLCGANLLGAELRGANLMGATLYGVEGLWLGRLGGANLYDAMLPETISSVDGSKTVWEATRSARWFYFLMLAVCALCALGVAATADPRLILDGPTVPFARLGNILPINGFYLIAPIALVVLFVRFQFLLLRVWSSMSALPAVFPDGQTVERGGPWYLMGLVRRHFRWLRDTKTPVSWMENVIATLLAYWAVPATIALLWMRYLVRQDLRGTSLHVLFFVLSVSVATGLPSVVSRVIRTGEVRRPAARSVARLAFMTLRAPLIAGAVLLTLSFGIILGIPADSDASSHYFSASPRRWAAEVFRLVGYRPYADLVEAPLVPRARLAVPSDTPADGSGAKLNENSLRYARAYRATLAGARLWRADLIGAYLTEADLRYANLREAHLRDAILDHARAEHAVLISADGSYANLTGADLRSSDMTYANFQNAAFAGARLGSASAYGANLQHSNWLRADLTRTDMRDSQLQNSEMSLANLELTDLSGAKLAATQFAGAQFKGTVLLGADLRNAGMRGATFAGAVLRDAVMEGAQIDGADFRGALGLSAAQVCSTRGWDSAQFDPDVLAAVQAQCGAPKQRAN
jgi:uncharacterized protein YjbI with pentapeptide repeats